ncbi:hypothetical protein E2562_031460 [Oryza meyeriana var. granulata]|uniref:Uncharacterized protein n=1 Tax=Oryza meyeriana var. granulata TaxID=110450 RepID=A0A6G1BPS6_9ORYZ|nr:hypothetical protein E2562_031460 [Oryza meyeriana var. granulata]
MSTLIAYGFYTSAVMSQSKVARNIDSTENKKGRSRWHRAGNDGGEETGVGCAAPAQGTLRQGRAGGCWRGGRGGVGHRGAGSGGEEAGAGEEIGRS